MQGVDVPALWIVQGEEELHHMLRELGALVVLLQLAGSHIVPFHIVPFRVRVPYHVHVLCHVLRVLLYHTAVIVGNMLED